MSKSAITHTHEHNTTHRLVEGERPLGTMDLEEVLSEDLDLKSRLEAIKDMTASEIATETKKLDNRIRSLQSELSRVNFEKQQEELRLKENQEKIKLHKQLPYLVGHVVEVRPFPSLLSFTKERKKEKKEASSHSGRKKKKHNILP